MVGPATAPLSRSTFVDEYVSTRTSLMGLALAEEIAARPELRVAIDGYVIYSDDDIPRGLASSNLSMAERLRILPARRAEGLHMLGSKVGLAQVGAAAGVVMPESVVVDDATSLSSAIEHIGIPCLIKADVGGGGGGIAIVRDPANLPDEPVREYPLVVQRLVDGDEMAVDAIFDDGRLLGWAYARVTGVSGLLGPSTVRRYGEPPSRDCVDALLRLGEHSGLTGLFNCTFVWERARGRHLRVEADPRPNAWHQFGPRLGLDWVGLLTEPPDTPVGPVLPPQGIVLHLYPRELASGIPHGDSAATRPWATRASGTWETRNRRDAAVNRAEDRQVLGMPGFTVTRQAWRLIPESVRDTRRGLVAKQWGLRLFGFVWESEDIA